MGASDVFAAALSPSNFDLTQFLSNGANQPIMSLRSGVIITNPVVGSGTLTGNVSGATNANGTTLFGSGIIPVAFEGSGTPTAATALFGDGTWKLISASGNLIAEGTNGITCVTNGQLVTVSFNGYNVVVSNASFLGPFTGVGAAAGKITLNSGSGTGGYFDFTGATASNHFVMMVNGQFVDGGPTNVGSGSVTSVGLALPSIFSISGSPVTTSGTLTGTLTTETANTVFSGPTSGGAATPTFRALVTADLPAGVGTVTSVQASGPDGFTWSGGPITSSGTLTATTPSPVLTNSTTLNVILKGTTNHITGDIGIDGSEYVGTLIPTNITGPYDATVQYFIGTNGSGKMGFSRNGNSFTNIPNSGLQNGSITVNGTANHVTTTSASISLGGSATLDVGSSVALRDANNAFTTGSSNYFAGAVTTSTNQNNLVPDFTVEEQLSTTNANFTFLQPVGIDTTKKTAQWTLVTVTNTSAPTPILATAPAGWDTTGSFWITNRADFWFRIYAGSFSNVYGITTGGTGSGGGNGTVTSVAMTVPAEFSISGSPITTSGTLALTKANENANLVFAGPTSGGAAVPTFRSLVAADIPSGVASPDISAFVQTWVGFDDFLGMYSATAQPGCGIFLFRQSVSGGGDRAAAVGTTNAPGIWETQLGGVPSASVMNNYAGVEPYLLRGIWTNEWRFRVTQVNQGTPNQNYNLYIGFGNTTDGSTPTTGAYFQYDTNATTIKYVTALSSTRTTNDSTVTPSANTWYKARLVATFNASTTNVTFTIDGAHSVTDSTVASCPSSSGVHLIVSGKKIDGGGNSFIDTDYCYMGYTLEVSR